jgi:hypothetical protein
MKLQDYDFTIHHVKGKINSAADTLSQSDDMEKCKEHDPTIVLLDTMFAHTTQTTPKDTMQMIRNSQNYYADFIEGPFKTDKVVIPPDKDLKCHLMSLLHDYPTAGHLG